MPNVPKVIQRPASPSGRMEPLPRIAWTDRVKRPAAWAAPGICPYRHCEDLRKRPLHEMERPWFFTPSGGDSGAVTGGFLLSAVLLENGIPPPPAGAPPFNKGGLGAGRSQSYSKGPLAKGGWHGAAVTGGFLLSAVLLENGIPPPPAGAPPFNKGGLGA